jgi:hypothetical protein
MQHFFKLFLLVLLLLNFVTPAQKLQASNSDWVVKQIGNPVFSQQDPNSGYPQITVTSSQSRSRVPCKMPSSNDLKIALQNYRLVPVPNLKTSTVQEFDLYFMKAEVTIEEALNWRAAYVNYNYIAIIKELPDYDKNLNKLRCEYSNQSDASEWFSHKFGSQPENFINRLDELYSRRVHEREIEQAARKQAYQLWLLEQARQKSQATIRQTWPENFELLQQDIPEWQELGEIFLEHKFGDSARLQKRIAVLNQLSINNNLGVSSSNTSNNSNSNSTNSSGNNNFITQSYNISPEINYVLQDTGLNHIDYTSCYGNPVQQLLHQENLDQLQQLGTLSPLSPIFYHKSAIAECVDSAREYNQVGLVCDSVKVTDMCWALLDYGKVICEGAAQGLIMVAKDLVGHPEHALLLVVAGEYVLAYQIAKVAYEVAKIGLTAWQNTDQGQTDWNSYIAPVTELVNAFENNEIAVRDALKTGTMLAVGCRVQGKLSNGLGKLCKVTKSNALTYLKNNPHATPQLYMSTPDGKIFKATGEIKKLSNRKCRLERIKHAKQAAAPITEFLTGLSEEALEKAVRYATTDTKLIHFFGDPKDIFIKHNFANLLNEVRDRKKVVEKTIVACIGKIPKDGAFENILVNVSGYEVYVRGTVINGIPDLGTIFIK